MTLDPAITEAAARALADAADLSEFWGNPPETRRVATAILAAVTPLIRDQVLEEAAQAVEEWTGQILAPTIGDHYALLIRALKEQP